MLVIFGLYFGRISFKMKVYKDLLSGCDCNSMDELFTDSKKVEEVKECRGLVRVPVRRVTESNSISDSLIGGNASAEGEDAADAAEDGAITGIDIVMTHQLTLVDYFEGNFKSFQNEYFKPFCKSLVERLKEHDKDKCQVFMKDAGEMLKFIKAQFKDIVLYAGKTWDVDKEEMKKHAICFTTFGEDGMEDYMYYIKDALYEEKV